MIKFVKKYVMAICNLIYFFFDKQAKLVRLKFVNRMRAIKRLFAFFAFDNQAFFLFFSSYLGTSDHNLPITPKVLKLQTIPNYYIKEHKIL